MRTNMSPGLRTSLKLILYTKIIQIHSWNYMWFGRAKQENDLDGAREILNTLAAYGKSCQYYVVSPLHQNEQKRIMLYVITASQMKCNYSQLAGILTICAKLVTQLLISNRQINLNICSLLICRNQDAL